MRFHRLFLFVLGLAVVVGAAGFGVRSWQQARERAQRSQRRSQELAKGLDALRTGAGGHASVRKELEDVRELAQRNIPEWRAYEDGIAKCLDLDERMREAAAQARYQPMALSAIDGTVAAVGLADRVLTTSKEETGRLAGAPGEREDGPVRRGDAPRPRV